jgi:hypothetical protein
MFILLRKLEGWLHQHVFKVGWLLTKNFQTTTTLYYTFFLPGVILHELVIWLVAGALNVRADRAIKYPEPQEIGELRLNFVQVSTKATLARRTVIAFVPLLVALTLIWFIASNNFNINAALQTMSTGDLDDVAAGFRQLTGTADFWLWFYLVFTISNTMFPTLPKDLRLRVWWIPVGALIVIAVVLGIIGIGETAFNLVAPSINQLIGSLQGMMLMIIGMNLFVTLLLGTIEAVIERVTGNTATFRRGKMITMTRVEAAEQRVRDQERARRQPAAAPQAQLRRATETRLPTIYNFAFPVPGAPGEELIAGTTAAALPGFEVSPAASAIPADTAQTPEAPRQPVIRIPADFRASQAAQAAEAQTQEADTQAELKREADTAVSMFRTNTPAPQRTDTQETQAADAQPAQPPRPAASLSPFARPAAPPPAASPTAAEDDDLDDEEDYDEDDYDDEEFDEEDDEETPAEKPVVPSRPATNLSPFARPAAPTPAASPTAADEDDDLEDEEDYDEDDYDDEEFDEDDEETPAEKPVVPSRPATNLSQFARPAASPFGATAPRPANQPAKADSTSEQPVVSTQKPVKNSFDDVEDEPAKASPPPKSASPFAKPAASPFGVAPFNPSRPASPQSPVSASSSDEDDDDEDDLRDELRYEDDEDDYEDEDYDKGMDDEDDDFDEDDEDEV